MSADDHRSAYDSRDDHPETSGDFSVHSFRQGPLVNGCNANDGDF